MRISDWSSDVCSSDLHFHNCRRLHLASYYLSMIEQGVGRQIMLIRYFIPGEETELRRVFMSSVHGLARGFYTPEQLDAWAPVVHDKQDWANRIAALRPFVATIEDRVAGYADLQDSGYIDHFFVS